MEPCKGTSAYRFLNKHSFLDFTSYPHMESAQGSDPIQWVTGTGLDIKDREKRISAKKENCLGKQSQGSVGLFTLRP